MGMEGWIDPAVWHDSFRFTPLPAENAPLQEDEAIEVADRAYYEQRWPNVHIVAQYGRYDDGGRGTTLIRPPDLPDPPYPPGGWEHLSPAEQHSWQLRRRAWQREAEHRGQMISHRHRLVWLVAFIGIDAPLQSPTHVVRVKVVDVATRRVLAGYQQPLESIPVE
jgi:hypothetical protein